MTAPFAREFDFRTPLSVEAALRRLQDACDPADPRRTFNGQVEGAAFVLARIDRNHPNAAASGRMRGRIERSSGGAVVSGRYAPTAFLVWLSASGVAALLIGLGFIVAKNLRPGAPAANLIIPLGLAAATAAVCALSPWIGARRDIAALAAALEAERQPQ